MALPTPPQQDTDEYYTDELEMNSLLINNLKIQLYLTHLLNIDQQQKKKRGRKARRWYSCHSLPIIVGIVMTLNDKPATCCSVVSPLLSYYRVYRVIIVQDSICNCD